MADPIHALTGLQRALNDGVPLGLIDLDSEYKTRFDESDAGKRYVFAKVVNGEVQALAIFGLDEPINGIECYSVGYAVSEVHRRRGLASEAFNRGVEQLEIVLRFNGTKSFYVEAVIDMQNLPSIRCAEKLFSSSGIPVVERETGTKALQFLKLLSTR